MTDFYVANNGDDGNNGHSGSPWRTIGRVAGAMSSGEIGISDCVYFRGGDVFNNNGGYWGVRPGGTETAPMIIGSYETGKAILENFFIEYDGPTNSGYYTFENLVMRNSPGTEEIVYWGKRNSHDVNFINVDVSNSYQFILFNIDTYKLENCTFTHMSTSGVAIYGDGRGQPICNGYIKNVIVADGLGSNSDGITLHEDGGGNQVGSNHILEDCISHGNAEDGFDITSGSNIQLINCEAYNNNLSGIWISHHVSNVVVDGAYCHDNGVGIGVGGDSTNTTIRNSITMNNTGWEIVLYGTISSGGFQHPLNGATVENNIFIKHPSAHRGCLTIGDASGVMTFDLIFENNIFISGDNQHSIQYNLPVTPENSNSYFEGNHWWGSESSFAVIDNVYSFSWWEQQSYTYGEIFQLPDCTDPYGYIGMTRCGIANGEDPTHQYECTATGWVDNGEHPDCMGQPCTNPAGTHGQVYLCGDGGPNQPDTTHKYQCNDGTWDDLGENCPYCPDCGQPPQDCMNPVGVHGQIDDCGDGGTNQPDTTHKYQCNDGTWDDLGENCPFCPDCEQPPPPPPVVPPWVWILMAGIGIASGIMILKGGEK